MKKILCLLFVCFAFNACETDFDVTSEWEEIPIVYGVLDRSKNVQYIKINKAFLGEVNALEAAQVVDSLYFPEDMEVRIKSFKFNNNITPDNYNLNVDVSYQTNDVLERVTLESEGLEKEEGTFANDPAYVYKYTRTLEEDYGYVLEFTTPTGKNVKAYTPILEDFRITLPNDDSPFDLQIASNKENWKVRWNEAENAGIFDVTFKLNYSEAPSADLNNRTFKTIYWTPIRNYNASTISVGVNYYDPLISKEAFYGYLNSVIEKDDNLIRFMGNLEIQVIAASEEMSTYLSASANQTGISSGQVKPEYSNISNGLGIFTTGNKSSVIYYSFINDEEWACDYSFINELNFAPPEGSSANWPFCD